MASDKAILRAGTRKLIAKGSGRAIAARSHPFIYVSCALVSGVNQPVFFPIACLDSKTLLPLWTKERISYDVTSRASASYTGVIQFNLHNDILLISSQGVQGQASGSRHALFVADIGMNIGHAFLSPTTDIGTQQAEVRDMFTTANGYIFLICTNRIDVYDAGRARLYCLDLDGNVITYLDIEGVRCYRMAGNLEVDNGFRIYLVGWRHDDPEEDDYACDQVFCVSFDADTETFNLEWNWVDPDSVNEDTLISGVGRAYVLYAPKPMASTKGTVYLTSVCYDVDGYDADVAYARITVITDGVTVHQWMVRLNDVDDAQYIPYSNAELDGHPDWGWPPACEGALVYRNFNHWFYFRGTTKKYPDSLFRLNLTTGAAAEELDAVNLPTEYERVRLMGISEFKAEPWRCDTLLIQTPSVLKIVSFDDLETAIASKAPTDILNPVPGYGGYTWIFRTPRQNRQLKLA